MKNKAKKSIQLLIKTGVIIIMMTLFKTVIALMKTMLVPSILKSKDQKYVQINYYIITFDVSNSLVLTYLNRLRVGVNN